MSGTPRANRHGGTHISQTKRLTNRCQTIGQRPNDHIGFANRLSRHRQARSGLGATQFTQCAKRIRVVARISNLQTACVKIVHRDFHPARKATGVLQVEHVVCAQTLRRGDDLSGCPTLGVDAFAERSELRYIAFTSGSNRRRVADCAAAIDENGCSIRNSGARQICAIRVGNSPLGLKIRQQREGNTPQIAAPVGVAMNTVDADTQNLGVCGLKAGQKSLDPRHFLASGGCPIEGIKEK